MKHPFYKVAHVLLFLSVFMTFFSCDFVRNKMTGVRNMFEGNNDSTESKKKASLQKESDKLQYTEHRIYYFDYSGSMEGRGDSTNNPNAEVTDANGVTASLFEHTKKHLIKAIEKTLKDPTKENVIIEVIPFFKDVQQGKLLVKKDGKYNANEWVTMREFINNYPADPSGSTYHSKPINDFIGHIQKSNNDKEVFIMILLTDGADIAEDDHKEETGVNALNRWPNNAYGILCDLVTKNSQLKGTALAKKFNGESKRYYISGLDFDINIFKIQKNREVKRRSDNIIYIPFGKGGKRPRRIELVTQSDSEYNYTYIDDSSEKETWIKVKVEPRDTTKKLPDCHSTNLVFNYVWDENNETSTTKNFPACDTVNVKVRDEKSPYLVFEEQEKEHSISYHKRILGLPCDHQFSDTIHVDYTLSQDAVKNLDAKYNIKVDGLPNFIGLNNTKGEDIKGNNIELEKKEEGTIDLIVTLDSDNENLDGDMDFTVSINLPDTSVFETVIWNGDTISSKSIGKKGNANLKICADEEWNPIEVLFLWLIIGLLFSLLALYMCIMVHRRTLPRFSSRTGLQFSTDPEFANLNINPNYLNLSNYANKCVNCLVYEVTAHRTQNSPQEEKWGLSNFWDMNLAWNGNIYKAHIDANPFIDRITIKPGRQKLEIHVKKKDSNEIMRYTLRNYDDIVDVADNLNVKLCLQYKRPTVEHNINTH